MSDPRDVPGWTQQREPVDDSERRLLLEMQGDGYNLTRGDLDSTYEKLGGFEHIEMIESLIIRGYCEEEQDEESVTWKLTEQGRKAIGL